MKHRSTKKLAGIMTTVIMFSAVPMPGIASEPIFSEQAQYVSDEMEDPEKRNPVEEDTTVSGEGSFLQDDVLAEQDPVSQQDGKNDIIEEDLENLTGDASGADEKVIEDTMARDDVDKTVMVGETSSDALPEDVTLERSTDANEIESRTMVAYSYTLSEVKITPSSIGGVSAQTIFDQAKTIIEKNEGSYGSVNSDDNGALSIGKMQWHAYRAARLLKAIISANNSNAFAILGDSLYNEIVKLSESSTDVWSNRILSDEEANRISKLLQTTEGKTLQDTLEKYDISSYINRAYSLGLRNASAVVYYADVENQFGSGRGADQVEYAANIAGSRDKVTLNEIHMGALCYNTSYNSRRFRTYGYAATLGWNGCPSVNEQIPYGSAWSDGQGVRWLQNALNTYMNAGLDVDGQYGSATEDAVLAFQKSAGLAQDGKAGVDTVSKLIFNMYRAMARGESDSVTTITGISSIGPDIIYRESDGKWIYVVNGVQDTSFTGVAKNKNGWWYVKNGEVDFGHYGVEQNQNGWWRIEAGKVNFNFNGFAENRNGWWYLEEGKVQLDRTDVIQGVVDGENGWWYVEGGKVTDTNTVAQNRNGWWYIENGKVDFGHYGVEQNRNGWWRIEAGEVNFDFNGFAENRNGWWYLEGGKVQLDRTDVIRGVVNGERAFWYVRNGHVETGYSGLVVVNGVSYVVEKGKIRT